QRLIQHTLLQSATTRERTVKAFLLARVGQRCSERRLAELARVVRAQPYLSSVAVRAVDDSAGGVRLLVETVDELPIIIGGGYKDGGLSNLTYGNENI